MNQRILEIADKAQKQAYAVYTKRMETEFPGDVIFHDIYNSLFAELIVQECADLFRLTFTDEQYQRRIDKTILKHFGVEETKREKFRNSFEEAFKDGVDLSGRNTP
jgi:hypothetical protein